MVRLKGLELKSDSSQRIAGEVIEHVTVHFKAAVRWVLPVLTVMKVDRSK